MSGHSNLIARKPGSVWEENPLCIAGSVTRSSFGPKTAGRRHQAQWRLAPTSESKPVREKNDVNV